MPQSLRKPSKMRGLIWELPELQQILLEASRQPPCDHHHNESLFFQTFYPMMPLHATLAQF